MIDHVSLQVTDVARSRAFYDAVLAPLGLYAHYRDGEAVGFAEAGAMAPFWLTPAHREERRELHLAFRARDRAAVQAFHRAAVGVRSEVLHPPRLFPEYHPDYFGCFVRDPDGHNVEAVCHDPEVPRP